MTQMPPKPARWEELCHDVGLAVLLAQKVQFALVYYYACHLGVRAGWNKSQTREKISYFLSKPMGVVWREVKEQAPLPCSLTAQIEEFKADRDWLVHNFDQESTPFISRGKRIDQYIGRMEAISAQAQDIMLKLDVVGDELMQERGMAPEVVKRMAEEKRRRT